MQTATRVLLFTLVFSVSQGFTQVGPTTAPLSDFPGPCRSWLFPCGKGSWVCTSEAAYWKFVFGPQPECPAVYPQTTAPPPGDCRLVNGQCQFTDSTLKCKAWLDEFNGNKCGSESEYVQPAKSQEAVSVKGFGNYPPPNQLCLPVNNSCQWYDPCLSWRDVCTNDNVCSSADEYYIHLYGPQPSCSVLPPGQIPTDPPGQCAIKKDRCDWYECVSWMGWCHSGWLCGTVYDRDTDQSKPPPSCPMPPPSHLLPGICKYNISSHQCAFFPNSTNSCYQPIYPPGFLTHCNALLKQWTYNSTAGKCEEFYYFACGEARDGYNVFSTEQECTGTCIPQGPCSKPIYPSGFNADGCLNFLKQWTYNPKAGQCVEFNYHSCGEDRQGYNVFDEEEGCINTCINKEK